MMLSRFRSVVCSVVQMPLRGMRVMSGRLVITFFVVSRRFPVMARRVFVMFRCFLMMLCRLLRHSSSSFHCFALPDSSSQGRVLLCR